MTAPTINVKLSVKPGMKLRNAEQGKLATAIYIVNADHEIERRWGVMWENGDVTVVSPDMDSWWNDFEVCES